MKQIEISGLVPFTTIDYPGKLAAVLFLCGCPLRCVYCSNPHLLEMGPGEYDPEKIMDWLDSRQGKLEAVVFSGGEALMQGDATIEYMKKVKEKGFSVGLHTNGFYPKILEEALPFLDWVGLDFKASAKKYTGLTGNSAAYERMQESLDKLLASGKEFEVRITCDPRYVSKTDILEIGEQLSSCGVKSIALQKYEPHFEAELNKTTTEERNQFFNDENLKSALEKKFQTVMFRNS